MFLRAVATVPNGQGFKQLGELALAFVLSSLIGLEREWRQKSPDCGRIRSWESARRCS